MINLAPGFVDNLGRYCPALEDLHLEGSTMEMLRSVASPTLRRFVVVRSYACAHLMILTPRLALLHLELAYDGRDCHRVALGSATATGLEPPPLASLAEATIRLMDTSYL